MHSLKEVFGAITQADHEKVAQAQGYDYVEVDEGLLKQAQDYDHAGRVLAYTVFEDMIKQAVDEEAEAEGEGDDEEKKKKKLEGLMAMARGEAPKKKKEEGEEEEEEEEGEEGEKKASVKAAILQRMAQDPSYVSHLIAKHYPG